MAKAFCRAILESLAVVAPFREGEGVDGMYESLLFGPTYTAASDSKGRQSQSRRDCCERDLLVSEADRQARRIAS
jgi:hypothetical protein